MIRVKKGSRRICQGDILKDIEYIEYALEKSGIIEVSKILFPLVIVLTQDCDLEQDYQNRREEQRRQKEQKEANHDQKDEVNHDKFLVSVLVAPLYNAEHVYLGEHLSELKMKMQPINSKKSPGQNLRINLLPRFHYLEFPQNTPIVPSVIDFKHYFSVNVKYLHSIKKAHFLCSVSPLYREDISHRFSGFLARIGLPEFKLFEPSTRKRI